MVPPTFKFTSQVLLALYGISGRGRWWWWFQCEFSIAISSAIRTCNVSRRQDGSLEWPPPSPVQVKRGRCSTSGSHGKGKERFGRGETVFFSLPILVNCSARTINVIVFNCLRRMSVTFKMVSRDDKSWRASWAWSPPVVESVARLATWKPALLFRRCLPEFRQDIAYNFASNWSNATLAFGNESNSWNDSLRNRITEWFNSRRVSFGYSILCFGIYVSLKSWYRNIDEYNSKSV